MKHEDRERLAQELLELLFDCHPEPDALRARLAADPELRALHDEVAAQAEALRTAARVEAPRIELLPPPPRRGPWRRPWLRTLFAAGIALTAWLGAAAYQQWRAAQLAAFRAANLALAVTTPRWLPSGAPATVTTTVHDLSGVALDCPLEWRLLRRDGAVAAQGRGQSQNGQAAIALPGSFAPLAAVEVTAHGPTGTQVVKAPLRVGDAPPLVHLATDRPIYRPGETVFLRSVVLDRLTLTPRHERPYLSAVVKDGRGAVVHQVGADALDPAASVHTACWTIPAGQAGGTFTWEVSDGRGGGPTETLAFLVRDFQPPRLRKTVTLDRTTYAPGERGAAEVEVERMAGGTAAGAKVEANLVLDGTPVWQDGAVLDARGRATFAFRVPEAVAQGAARFVARVTDGSVVETEVKPFVVPTGIVNAAFSPEGGDLVAGLRNRVYVELTDPLGRPVSGRGVVVEAGGGVVAQFATAHEGRGRFELTPVAGRSYQLELAEPAGRGFALPQVQERGAVLRAVQDGVPAGAPVRVAVASVPAQPLSVRVFCRGVQVGSAELPAAAEREVAIAVPVEVVGVLRVTVFDAELRPLAERLVQRLPQQQVALTLAPERAVVAPGAGQRVRVSTRDERGQPVAAVVGLCVTDQALEDLGTAPRVGLVDRVQLLADSQGGEDLKTVLAGAADAARNADLVLGTQGWRRFAWREPDPKAAVTPALQQVRLREGNDRATQQTQAGVLSWSAPPLRAARRAEQTFAAVGVGALLLVLAWLLGECGAWLVRRIAVRPPVWAQVGGAVAGVGLVAAGLLACLWFLPGSPVRIMSASIEEALAGTPAAGAESEDKAEHFDVAFAEQSAGVANMWSWGERDPRAYFFRGYLSDFSVEVAQGAFVVDPAVDPTFIPPADLPGLLGYRLPRASCVREYHHQTTPHDGRSDFAPTVCWQPLLVTDAQGEASVAFDVGDQVTTWQVHADAHAPGRVGQALATFVARQPFHLEAQLPVEVTQGDALLLPVAVAAEDQPRAEVRLSGHGLPALSTDAQQVVVLAAGRGRALFPLAIDATEGRAELTLAGTAGRYTDLVRQELRIVPRGFQHTRAWGGVLQPEGRFTLTVPEQPVPGSLRATLKVFPSPVALLGEGLEGLLQEPHGCFEQASSTNYPNLLALSYVQASGDNLPGLVAKARTVLPKGYQLLTGYECKQRGYEWFGADPGHEALTAYGLMEFADMAKVFPVDRAMVDRTRAWLLGRRDGQGGFQAGSQNHSFGRVGGDASSAYVLYALLESGEAAADLRAELDRAAARAAVTPDSYELALCACALGKAGRSEAAAARQRLRTLQAQDGGLRGAVTSITSSGGDDLRVETTGFAILAWLRDPAQADAVRRGIEFLHGRQQGGGTFGATQATVVALRAITAYAQDQRVTPAPGTIKVWVGETLAEERAFAAGAREPMVFDLLPHARPGANPVRIELVGGGRPMPFACEVRYHADLPADDPECVLEVATALAAERVVEGRTVGLRVAVTNRSDATQPMTIAVVGLPAGLEAPTTVLEDLKKSGALDFWELRGRELCCYWRGLDAHQRKELQLDLVARIPGSTSGPASRAWLYYTPQSRRWAAPLRVQIEPAR